MSIIELGYILLQKIPRGCPYPINKGTIEISVISSLHPFVEDFSMQQRTSEGLAFHFTASCQDH